MRFFFLYLSVCLFFFTACEIEYEKDVSNTPKHELVRLNGYPEDTAYLFAEYKDLGADIVTNENSTVDCCDRHMVTNVKSTLNNRIPGTYFIYYFAKDSMGNELATVTRTVHVVENTTTFLNGNYNVTCTYTALAKGSTTPLISSKTYTSSVLPGREKNAFDVSLLDLGPEALVSNMHLSGSKIEVFYYSPALQLMGGEGAGGMLAPTKDTFTIEAIAYTYDPVVKYVSKNIFSKQVQVK